MLTKKTPQSLIIPTTTEEESGAQRWDIAYPLSHSLLTAEVVFETTVQTEHTGCDVAAGHISFFLGVVSPS